MAGPDKETGKPRGYAFCEYHDVESAAQAIRLLNGRDFNGRSLRVDFADNQSAGGDSRDVEEKEKPSPNRVNIDQMREIIAQIPKVQLYEAISSIKNLILQDPDQAKQILKQNPILRFALIHSQYVLGMEKQLFGQTLYKTKYQQQAPQPVYNQYPNTNYQNYQQPVQTTPSPQTTQLQQLLKTISPQQLKELLALTPDQLSKLPEQTRQQVVLIQQHAAQLTKQLK